VAYQDLNRRLRDDAPLLSAARPALDWASDTPDSAALVVFLTDREGVVLASAGVGDAVEILGPRPGDVLSEAAIGTNGAGTALATGRAAAVLGPEHYRRALHGLAELGIPLHAPDGSIAGAVAARTSLEDRTLSRLIVAPAVAWLIEREAAVTASAQRAGPMAAGTSAAECRLHRLAETLPIPYLSVGPDGRLAYANAACASWVGIARDDLLGRHLSDTLGDGPCRTIAEYAARSDESPLSLKARVVLPDGNVRHVRLDCIPCRRHGGEIAGYDVLVADCLTPPATASGRRLSSIAGDGQDPAMGPRERKALAIARLEQRRIGQELHDGIGQELTGLGLLADTLAQQLAADSAPDTALAARLVRGLDRLKQQVRNLSHGLIPLEVDGRWLCEALEALASQADAGLAGSCTFEGECPADLGDPERATHLYRIAQQAVTNALSHGRASQIRIGLRVDATTLVLTVEDNGIGITAPHPHSRGLGLRLMRHRAEALDGSLSIEAAGQGGTIVTCRIPGVMAS
jgi:PAS domain S-box-containing protein